MAICSFASSAQAQAEPIRLTYSAPAQCSSESQFLQEVTARTSRVRRATPNEVTRTFTVTVTLEAATTRGRLDITSPDGSLSAREVTGDTCSEVVSALALMMALSIDPMASVTAGAATAQQEPGQDGATGEGTGPIDSSGTSPVLAPYAAEFLFGRPPAPTKPPTATDRSLAGHSEEMPPGSRRGPRWAVGGGGEAIAGLAPSWGLGGGIFVAIEGKARGYLVPAFRVSLKATAASAQFPPQAIGADLVWVLAGFEVCPLRLPLSPVLSASPCAALEGGVLHSAGASIGLQQNADVYKPWIAPAALGRLTWNLSERWLIEGAAGLTVPLVRYQFYYRDAFVSDVPVYQFPVAGATLGMQTGYRFP